MNKFLRLVEENRPGEDKYTVELKDVNGELIDSFLMFGTGSPFEIFDSFKEEWGSPIPVEDQEDDVTADAAIQAAAAADPNSPAGKAVQDRNEKLKSKVQEYEQATRGIK